ncbi:MAG: hypothetical protein HKO62_06740 [Gammaproteobacteria bacterium]|nr:hypothetical protein [Gammaproteobacteria bacterium]
MNEIVESLITSGRIVDIMLAVVVIEWLALGAWRVIRGNGLGIIGATMMLVPGTCLMLALRGALTGASWQWIALVLIASLFAHLTDMAIRIRHAP